MGIVGPMIEVRDLLLPPFRVGFILSIAPIAQRPKGIGAGVLYFGCFSGDIAVDGGFGGCDCRVDASALRGPPRRRRIDCG